MAATSIFLATKIEEDCRKMKELVIACVRVAQKDSRKLVDEQDKEYWRWKDNILHNEDVLLEALCFDLTLEPPYKILFDFLNHFRENGNRRLRNSAWAFINDSCMTTLCLQFSSRTIAASALYAAAKHCHTEIPDDDEGRPWWDVIGIDIKTVKQACNSLAAVYEQVQVKNGRDVSIHARTPEDGDGSTTKTRARHPQTSPSEQAGTPNPTEDDVLGISEGSRKRSRSHSETHNRPAVNGDSQETEITNGVREAAPSGDEKSHGEEKRRRIANGDVKMNGASQDHPVASSASPNRKEDYAAAEDISEEGELEA
ncbi:MAG: hypothetical protein Q9226_009107 [Calogaya cf. arnoldii]